MQEYFWVLYGAPKITEIYITNYDDINNTKINIIICIIKKKIETRN